MYHRQHPFSYKQASGISLSFSTKRFRCILSYLKAHRVYLQPADTSCGIHKASMNLAQTTAAFLRIIISTSRANTTLLRRTLLILPAVSDDVDLDVFHHCLTEYPFGNSSFLRPNRWADLPFDYTTPAQQVRLLFQVLNMCPSWPLSLGLTVGDKRQTRSLSSLRPSPGLVMNAAMHMRSS